MDRIVVEESVGLAVGSVVMASGVAVVGESEGCSVGLGVDGASLVGISVGALVSKGLVGLIVEGEAVGAALVGASVVGESDGATVGVRVGLADGLDVVGDTVGRLVGLTVGVTVGGAVAGAGVARKAHSGTPVFELKLNLQVYPGRQSASASQNCRSENPVGVTPDGFRSKANSIFR